MNGNTKKIGTHDGEFHADEVVATAILLEVFDNIEVVRTRNKAILNDCEIVYDVNGGVYDHHSVDKQYRENGIPFASAGLIWKDFGKAIIARKMLRITEAELEEVLRRVDTNFMLAVDALDNGTELYKCEHRVMSFSSIISGFNPSWNETDKNETDAFNEAVAFARMILLREIDKAISSLEVKILLKKDLEARIVPEVLILSKTYPWKKGLINSELGKDVLFVIFKDTSSGSYRLHTVPKEFNSFETRLDLPLAWAGKRDGDFDKITGITDGIFCHPSRFIAGAQSFESILQLAELALKEIKNKRITGYMA